MLLFFSNFLYNHLNIQEKKVSGKGIHPAVISNLRLFSPIITAFPYLLGRQFLANLGCGFIYQSSSVITGFPKPL